MMETEQKTVEYEKVKVSKLAIAAFIVGIGAVILSLAMGGFWFGIPGIILSISAFISIKRNYLEGAYLAKIGLVTSVIGLIGSIVMVVLITSGMGALENEFAKKQDVQVAEAMASYLDVLYMGPYEEELDSLIGNKIKINETLSVPECVEECLSDLWSDDQLHGPAYTDNGAYAYVILFGETECEAVYITDGINEWEVYPNVDKEYQ